ncbi:MAG: regulatory protein RecX [Lachnospiraceae bacterium]|nr:regulatory protein RecX [Lachnospiraceae bacterium]
MIVTEIEEISKSKCKVFLDGEFAFALYKGELSAYQIKKGKELEKKNFEELTEQVLPKRAKLRTMNLLKARPYTEEELRRKLRQGFYTEELISQALSYVKSYGYVDDLSYAMEFIRCRAESFSKKQIQNKLLQKGIEKEDIEKAFLKCEDEGIFVEEIKQMETYLKKKQYSPKLCDNKEKQKLMAALYRKGFSINSINQVMKSDFYLT